MLFLTRRARYIARPEPTDGRYALDRGGKSPSITRLLTEWSCVGGFSVYAMYRKASRRGPKVAAFLEFAEAAVAAFDGDELTIRHTRIARENRRVRDSRR